MPNYIQIIRFQKRICVFRSYLICLFFLVLNSCSKLVEIDSPVNSEIGKDVYSNDASAASALTGIYTNMSSTAYNGSISGLKSIGVAGGLLSDELSLYNNGGASSFLPQYFTNALTINFNTSAWALYQPIYAANAAIEGLQQSTTVSPGVKKQLMGEAKFIRAFCYFYLTNIYGDLPLVLTTDFITNTSLKRVKVADIYMQISEDLEDAISLLGNDYMKADAISPYLIDAEERVRPNKWVATALLSRVYLYKKDYINAISESTKLIDNNKIFSLVTDLNLVFLKNSKEAIWQIQPTVLNENTKDGILYVLPKTGPSTTRYPLFLSNYLLNEFDSSDLRKENWIRKVTTSANKTYRHSYKYKVGTAGQPLSEYIMVLRLAEQYLIRSEANLELNKLSECLNDLDIIRQRAGLNKYSGPIIKDSIYKALIKERQTELFTEWGHRWFDIKRMKGVSNSAISLADEIMPSICATKGGNWSTNWQLLPIPSVDIDRNPNLLPNNTGY